MAKGAEADVVSIDSKAEQLEMFEGVAVNQYRGSIAAAGYLVLEDQLTVGQRVAITTEGYVSKVTFHKRSNGIVVRQHVIVVDQDETEIKAL